ncbi:MAG: 50S ribosomal protein L23 [Patescibacteria group bacterium]|nr:50S ribosomal protein L23 [Patescibacteria group bacterium]
MALKDLFKRKKKEEVKEKKEEKKEVEKKPENVKKEPVGSVKKIKPSLKGFAYQILKSPHITEKATDLAKENKYVFRVYPRTNKIEIKKAVELLYGVKVLSVKIIKVPPKKRVFKGIKGERSGYKKAIVEVLKGQKIEIASG